jgi:hypothetical protein
MKIAQLDRWGRELAPDNGPCVEVVVPRPLAQRVELHPAPGITRKSQRATLLEEGLEAQLVGGFSKVGIHGNELLLLYRDNNVTEA